MIIGKLKYKMELKMDYDILYYFIYLYIYIILKEILELFKIFRNVKKYVILCDYEKFIYINNIYIMSCPF